MVSMIFTVILVFLALVGTVNLLLAVQRWVANTGELQRCTLVLEIADGDPGVEAALLHAADGLSLTPLLSGTQLVVLCSSTGETGKICQRFCGARNIKLVTGWEELP